MHSPSRHEESNTMTKNKRLRSRKASVSGASMFENVNKWVNSPFKDRSSLDTDRIELLGWSYGRKFCSYALPASISSAWTVTRLANIAEGTDFNQRIGREIVLDTVRVAGLLLGGQTNIATDDSYNHCRIVIIEAIHGFTSGSLGAVGVLGIIDPRSVQGVKRVIHDVCYKEDTPGRDSTGYVPSVQWVKEHANLGMHVKYTSAAGADSNMYEPYICFVTDSGLPSNPGFSDGAIVVAFHDVNSK